MRVAGLKDFATLADWEETMRRLAAHDFDANCGDGPLLFLMPNCIGMPDHCHGIFGSLEEAGKRTVGFQDFYNALHDVSSFLAESAIVGRYAALSRLSRAETKTVLAFVGDTVDWKWEYFGTFCWRVLPVLKILVRTFSASRICQGLGADGSVSAGVVEVQAKVIKKCGRALETHLLVEKTIIAGTIARATDREGTWCEGCPCHQFILENKSIPYKQRLAQYRKASSECANKGLRGTELALGQAKEIPNRIRNATSNSVREVYSNASLKNRQQLMAFEQDFKQNTTIALDNFLKMWDDLPYTLFQFWGHQMGLVEEAQLKQAGLQLIELYQGLVRSGTARKLHRRARKLLDVTGPYAALFYIWCREARATLRDFPPLYLFFRGISRVPVVCRRIEASHAEYKGLDKRMTAATFAFKAAGMRRKDIERQLDRDEDFIRFLRNRWRYTLWLHRAAKCIDPHVATRTKKEILKIWYQSNIETQFSCKSEDIKRLEDWSKLTKHCFAAALANMSNTEHMVSRFVKHTFSDPNAAWSMPRSLMTNSYVRFTTSPLELFIDLIGMAGTVRKPVEFTDHVFFIVGEAFPERKHVIRAPYVELNAAEVYIFCDCGVSFAEHMRPSVMKCSAKFDSATCCSLDTRIFARPNILAQLWKWELCGAIAQPILPLSIKDELRTLDLGGVPAIEAGTDDLSNLPDETMIADMPYDSGCRLVLFDGAVATAVHAMPSTASGQPSTASGGILDVSRTKNEKQ